MRFGSPSAGTGACLVLIGTLVAAGVIPMSRAAAQAPAAGAPTVRLTSPADCRGGADCVLPAGDVTARRINNHRGRDSILVLLGLRGAGPTLFSYQKSSGRVRNLGPLFTAPSPYASSSGEGFYFSARQPTRLYVTRPLGARLQRYDVATKTFETAFDAAVQFGEGKYIWHAHSSDDDNVHSAVLRDLGSHAKLGCLAYREDARQFVYHQAVGELADCQVDRSGRWLVIRE